MGIAKCIMGLIATRTPLTLWLTCLEVCLFVYFHQLSVTMNNNKVEGSNRNKTMKKTKIERKNYTH